MARYMMEQRVSELGFSDEFEIGSAATSSEETGNPVYPPAARKLAEHGIRCSGHRAHRMTAEEFGYYDLVIAMDRWNLSGIRRIAGEDSEGKVHLMMDYTDRPGEVADPWYTGDFDATWRDLEEGIEGLLASLGFVRYDTSRKHRRKR